MKMFEIYKELLERWATEEEQNCLMSLKCEFKQNKLEKKENDALAKIEKEIE